MDVLAVIWAPVRSLARVAEERRLLLGFGVVALYAALSLLAAVVDVLGGATASAFTPENFPGLPPDLVESTSQGSGATTLLPAVLSPLVGWVVVSLLMQLVTRFFGGTGPLPGTFTVVDVAAVPLVISAVIRIPVTGLEAVAGPDRRRSLDPELPALRPHHRSLHLEYSARDRRRRLRPPGRLR